jgi:hypothetical protein
MERNISRLACVLALSAVGFGAAAAETIGNLQDGHALVQHVCSQCHATAREQDRSPNPKAPRFADLAATSGIRQPRYWSRSRRRTRGCLCSRLRPARGTTSSRISSACIRSTERDAQTKTAASHAPIRLYDALRSRRAALGVACDECRPRRVHTALHDRCARSPLAFALAGHLRFTAQ